VNALASFLALSTSDKALLLRAFATLGLVRGALLFLPLARLRAWAQRRGAGARSVDRVVWAISAASRRTPGTTCLVSAFALQRLLAREGHVAAIHIGVAKKQERLAAHAWVECEGRMLIGAYEAGDYTHLLAWRTASSEPSAAPLDPG